MNTNNHYLTNAQGKPLHISGDPHDPKVVEVSDSSKASHYDLHNAVVVQVRVLEHHTNIKPVLI